MSFDLPTLTLATAYDAPQPGVVPDLELVDATHPAVVLLNSATTVRRRLLRARRADPVLGLRLEPSDHPVRVSVVLVVDQVARDRWDEAGLEAPPGAGSHRLVTVTAQGEPRGQCVLIPPQGQPAARQRLEFLLRPDELGDLLLVSLEPAEPPPGWGAPLPQGTIGLLVARMVLRPHDEPVPVQLSTGVQGGGGTPPLLPVDPGYAVLGPGSTGSGAEVRLLPVDGVAEPAVVQVADGGGRLLLDEAVVPGDRGVLSVPVPEVVEPLYLRVLDERSGTVRRAFHVRVRA